MFLELSANEHDQFVASAIIVYFWRDKMKKVVTSKVKNKKPFSARTDVVPITNFYLCGCGPYTTGVRRTVDDLATTRFHEKKAVEMATKDREREAVEMAAFEEAQK